MSVFNHELDLEVLKYALEHHASQLSDQSSHNLLQALQALQHQDPDAALHLCELVSTTAEIDRIYTQALTTLRQQYMAQDRAKSAVLTADHTGMLNGLGQLVDQLTATLKQVQSQASITQTSKIQLKILRALETHSLTLNDLTYATGLPARTLQDVVKTLRSQGYVDLLSAPLLHWLFPPLKPTRDRQQPIAEDEFLSLTAMGYFHLHPLIQTAKRGS